METHGKAPEGLFYWHLLALGSVFIGTQLALGKLSPVCAVFTRKANPLGSCKTVRDAQSQSRSSGQGLQREAYSDITR